MNPFDILKNADAIQQQFKQIQEGLENVSATGVSGGNLVKVTINGKMEITSVFLDPIAVDPRDIQMLQDLIVAAHHDAMTKLQDELREHYGSLLGGMPGAGM
ncbi:MAG: YbaB/EbfC family nucleoid-associated protein [Spirochaetaceae bacterium]|nr:YbaB/EbfC family nucleoid-associated protein [Spirochaetaceae bacterium]